MKTYYITEGTPTKKQDPGDIARQTAFENMPGFGTGIGVGIYNIGNIIGDLITDKEERQETLEVLQNSVQNVPYRLYNVFANQLPALATDIFKVADTDVDYDPEELKYLKTLNPEDPYKSPTGDPTGFKTNADRIRFLENYDSSVVAQRQKKADEFLKKKYKEIDSVNKYLIKDTGEGMVKGFKQGDASDFIGGIANANIQMVETVVPAMLTGGISLPFQIIAPMYTDYNTTKAENLYGKDDPEALNKLIDNGETEIAVPLTLGLVASGLEYIGFKGITKLMLGNQASSKFITNLLLTSNKEGITEWLQSGVEGVNEAAAQDKSAQEITKAFFDNTFSEKGFEAYLNGFVGSAGVGSGGTIINRALRSDNASVKKISSSIKNIAELTLAKNSTRDNEVKEALEQEIEQKELDLKNYILEKRKVADVLNDDQKASLINLINQKDDVRSKYFSLVDKLKTNQITKKEFGYSVRSLSNQNNRLTEQIELISASAKEQLLQTSLEKTAEEAEKLGLEQEELSQEEFAKMFPDDANSDGAIDKGKIFINRDVARETGAIGVGSHELLHGIIGNSYDKLTTEQKTKLNTNFLNILGETDRNTVLDRLAKSYGVTGDGIFTTEELFTAFSDSIVDGEIKYDESVFNKLANVFQEVLNKIFGYKKEFQSARQTFNFIKDYSINIKKGILTERASEFAKQDPSLQSKKMSATAQKAVKKTLDEIGKAKNFDPSNKEITNQLPAMAKVQVDNYFNNRPSLKADENVRQEVQAEILFRLLNPSKTGKTDINSFNPKINDSLYGYLNKRINYRMLDTFKENPTIVPDFSKADFDEATKFLTTEDVATTKKTEGVKTKLVQTKARQLTSLADLDVESSALIKETTRIKLAELIKSNPKNIVQEIQNVLIPDLVEIIRKEMGVIGEKKGELVIPESYKAYLADTYEQTISSMEILKIRTNYKNLFKRENMGFADYKTKKSDKPSLKKDSNYRKDIFRNVTTKAEFTKYHTEGKKNKLIANQRNLALMRAEAEAVKAADNYIIENSNDLNQVYAAELRKYIDSKTIEKQKLEDKSFDSVKFSKTTSENSLNQVNKLVNLIDNNAITDVFNLETQQPLKGKYDPEVVQIVFNQFLKGNIYSNRHKALVDIIKKIPKKLIKDNLGTAIEQYKIDVGNKAAKKYEGFTMLGEAVQEGGIPDFFADIHGFAFYAEAKFATSRGGKTTTNETNWKTGKFKINKRLEGNIEFVEKSVKRALKNSKQLVKELKKLGFDLVDQDTVVDLKTHKELGAKKAIVSDASVVVDADFIGRIYANKEYPVYLIDIDGAGLFYMPGDPFIETLAKELGIPKLEGKFLLITRILPQRVTKNGVKVGYKYKITTEPLIDPNNIKVKSDFSLSDIKTFDAIMNSKAVANLKIEQEAKNKTKFSKSISASRTVNDPKGITVLDFDDTLATTKSLVRYTAPDGTTGTLNAEQFANSYQGLLDKGYKFDFSEFNKVVKGKIAPLFQKALKLQGKFGSENMFVLTARPPQAQKAIFDFLKANGLNIPLKNITGLGNSTAEAKALWIAEKVGEGYNDFYFADDALQNVQAVKNMLDQFDVKSKVQQAKVKFSKTMSDDFNNILEDVTGIEAKKRFSDIKARKRGANKGKFRFFIPPSHEDFVGLLYNFMGKGRKGDAHRDFFEQALIRPLLRAHREIDTAKQAVANDYKALNKQMPEVRKMLTKKTPDGDFTYQDAIRVYIWDKHGYTIPGLSEADQKSLVDIVKEDSSLQAYAESINIISKQETYVDPGPNWETGNIRIDLVDATGRVGRKTYFAEFIENADTIFSEENLNKIEAGYGKDLKEALEDMLHRIKTGINRPKGASAKPNMFMNWLNASVSGVMFFNTRSSILQQMSNVNYLNFADNNIFAAGKAFANQKQYWADFAMIFNSDMLKQRRGGLQTDINGAELAEAIKKARPGNLFDQVAIIIGKALKLGFLPTQIGDNIAIATGGATFYRNRVNKYIKDGFPVDQAEKKAFNDFQEITQSTQQSAKPYMTSAQQAMWIGKLVLNFLNTPSQYNRIIKKAGSDIINRRITPPNTTQMQSDMSNMSRILYYGAAQNLIFYSLQTALFAVMFGGEDEDEDERIVQLLRKKERVINGTIDTILRGSGIYGVAVSTLKNMAIKFMEQRVKGYNKDEAAVVMELLNFSPVVGIKARRIVNAEKTLNYNAKVIEDMETFDIDNPMWSAVTNYTQTITTAPTNKIYQKVINLRNAADNDYTLLQRILFFSGYTTWSLGLGDTKKMKEIKQKVKSKNKKPRRKKIKTLTGF